MCESLGYFAFWLVPGGMLSSNVTSTSSPGGFPSAYKSALLSGRNWVPSPQGMNAVGKGIPPFVPFTFTDLVESK